MRITPEMLASLPPELQQEMHNRLMALLRDLGVRTMIAPDGSRVFDMAELAPALGMTMDEALAIADEAGMTGLTRWSADDLAVIQ